MDQNTLILIVAALAVGLIVFKRLGLWGGGEPAPSLATHSALDLARAFAAKHHLVETERKLVEAARYAFFPPEPEIK